MNESMQEYQMQLQLQERVCAWFNGSLGRSLQAIEANSLRQLLPQLYGKLAVQLGCPGRTDLLEMSAAPTHVVLDVQAHNKQLSVCATAETLPFETKSVDVVLLPHTLDFSSAPHQVLREVYRILTPEGHAVILGFNPFSLWGVRRLFSRKRDVPWCGQFIGLLRLKDWLALLDFELSRGNMLYYRPPLQHEGLRDRFYFLEKMGDRWWPLGAAVYLVIAKKRVPGLTPLPLPWRERKAPNRQGVAQPAAKSC